MTDKIPLHVAMIMDGNGRWAKKRLLPRSAGHLAGAKNILNVLEAALELGIKCVTVYAFSTENWKRPAEEVNYLMNLVPKFIDRYLPDLQRHNVRLRCIGRLNGLPDNARSAFQRAMRETAGNTALTFCIAVNYGGRAELVDAVNALMADKSRPATPVTEEEFAKYLYAPDLPEPDLLIRTGGEKRLSNFLLWELSYSELYVTDVLWPDFDAKELQKAIEAFGGRDRRFGDVK